MSNNIKSFNIKLKDDTVQKLKILRQKYEKENNQRIFKDDITTKIESMIEFLIERELSFMNSSPIKREEIN